MNDSSQGFDELEFLRDGVKIDTSESVEEIREFIVKTLSDHGVNAEVDDAGNLIASKGSGRPHLVLHSHMDTVEPNLEFEETEEEIRGRGACDAKASVAVFLKALTEADSKIGRLTVSLTPDEETESRKVADLGLDPDAVIVGEPTDLDICNSSKGRFEVQIEIEGETAHAANPEKGVNAVRTASKIINVLDDFDSGEGDDELGSPTMTPTVISGGESSNVVPETCRVRIDRRSVPGEKMEEFIERLSFFVENLDIEGDIEIRRGANNSPLLGAFRTPRDEKLVESLRQKAGDIRPFDAVCEASYFSPKPTVIFGPGKLSDEEGGVAHSEREYVKKEKVKKASETVKQAVEDYLS